MNRFIIIPISAHFLHSFLSGGLPSATVGEHGLPTDATLVNVNFDGRTVYLTYQSEKFDEVEADRSIPHRDVYFHSTHFTGLKP